MSEAPSAVLLDTCAVIWLANGELGAETVEIIMRAALQEGIYVSAISAWEIGLLSRPKANKATSLHFLPDPKTWFNRFMGGPGIKAAPFDGRIAVDASWLPGEFHNDPGDRLIVSTARHMQVPVVTRDSKIIDYARSGHVGVIPC